MSPNSERKKLLEAAQHRGNSNSGATLASLNRRSYGSHGRAYLAREESASVGAVETGM